MPAGGVLAAAVAFAAVAAAVCRADRRTAFGPLGWSGVATCLGAALARALLAADAAFLGALAWTGLIVVADSAVHSIRGRSLLRSRPEAFVWLGLLSIFLWVPFEWFNLRLAAWYRSGWPQGPVGYVLFGWASACIWPALYECADLLMALTARSARPRESARHFRVGCAFAAAAAGGACLVVPLVVPRLDFGERMVPLIPVGFLLLLDPLNRLRGRTSLWEDWIGKRWDRLVALAFAGPICGLVADLLNHGGIAKWHVIAFAGLGPAVFEIPIAAYAALPLFAWQAYAMHAFAAGELNLPAARLPSGTDPSDTERPGGAGR